MGFCMGGALSLLAAEHAKVDAAVSFYGTPVGHKELSHVRLGFRVTLSQKAVQHPLGQQSPAHTAGVLSHVLLMMQKVRVRDGPLEALCAQVKQAPTAVG